MQKMIICLRRRPDLTLDAFRQDWRDIHAPLVAEHAATLGIKRYVQVYGLEVAPTGGRPEGFDGIGEVWVESVEAFTAAAAPRRYRRARARRERRVSHGSVALASDLRNGDPDHRLGWSASGVEKENECADSLYH